ncbi:MAG: hypothetical protein RL266_1142 [Bacteroidota bacterium]|jgi:hypothetical protein
MDHLPEIVSKLLLNSKKDFLVAFWIDENEDAFFRYANQNFIDFHKQLSIHILEADLLDTQLSDYFRFYLGFSEVDLNARLRPFKEALKTRAPINFNEVSDHPGILALVLSSTWIPVEVEDQLFVIWESSVRQLSQK